MPLWLTLFGFARTISLPDNLSTLQIQRIGASCGLAHGMHDLKAESTRFSPMGGQLWESY